jgi:hypothetical protein
MIKIEYIDCPYVISKFEEHDKIKNTLLEFIDELGQSHIDDGFDKIDNTDYNSNNDSRASMDKKYWKFLCPSLTEHMKKVYSRLEFLEFSYLNCWFQQYYRNSFHNWHTHGHTNWTNIYYLELPSDDVRTHIKNQKTDSIVIPNVEEGYILTMPATLWHRSPINLGDKRKTVIAFNTTTPR